MIGFRLDLPTPGPQRSMAADGVDYLRRRHLPYLGPPTNREWGVDLRKIRVSETVASTAMSLTKEFHALYTKGTKINRR